MDNNIIELYLRTAFSCMACDGEIAKEELDIIIEMAKVEPIFQGENVLASLENLMIELKEKGNQFLKDYLLSVANANLNEEQSIDLLSIAAKTINADNVVKYSEIKFFKVIKSNLKVSNKLILEKVEGTSKMWVDDDIKQEYNQIYNSYFSEANITNIDFSAFQLKN